MVWIESRDIVKSTYSILHGLPEFEKFGLQSQISTAAVSIPSNIAEGCGKSSTKDFKRYLEIALGSSYELKTQLILAFEVNRLKVIPIIERLQTL